MTNTTCVPARDPDTAEHEWLPVGQDLRDVAQQLRVMHTTGTSFAIAAVLRAHATGNGAGGQRVRSGKAAAGWQHTSAAGQGPVGLPGSRQLPR